MRSFPFSPTLPPLARNSAITWRLRAFQSFSDISALLKILLRRVHERSHFADRVYSLRSNAAGEHLTRHPSAGRTLPRAGAHRKLGVQFSSRGTAHPDVEVRLVEYIRPIRR